MGPLAQCLLAGIAQLGRPKKAGLVQCAITLCPGIPAAQFDSFGSDEDAPDPIEDEPHTIYSCSGGPEAGLQNCEDKVQAYSSEHRQPK